MELRHFRYFAAVAEHLSFVKAAQALHISQPPLSRQIREFEAEVGTALFCRSPQGTSLTPAGAYLYAETRKLLATAEGICRTARVLGSSEERTLRLGCVSFLLNRLLPPWFRLLSEREPGLQLTIRVMSTEQQCAALEAGEIDLGFMRAWGNSKGLVFEALAEENLCIIFPLGLCHAEAAREAMAELADKPFVALSRSSAPGLADRLAAVCADYGISPPRILECDESHSIVRLVASGLGWSIVPDVAVRDARATGLGAINLQEPIVLGIGYREGELGEAASRALGLAREFFLGQGMGARAG